MELEREGVYTEIEAIKDGAVLEKLQEPRTFVYSRNDEMYTYSPDVVAQLKAEVLQRSRRAIKESEG